MTPANTGRPAPSLPSPNSTMASSAKAPSTAERRNVVGRLLVFRRVPVRQEPERERGEGCLQRDLRHARRPRSPCTAKMKAAHQSAAPLAAARASQSHPRRLAPAHRPRRRRRAGRTARARAAGCWTTPAPARRRSRRARTRPRQGRAGPPRPSSRCRSRPAARRRWPVRSCRRAHGRRRPCRRRVSVPAAVSTDGICACGMPRQRRLRHLAAAHPLADGEQGQSRTARPPRSAHRGRTSPARSNSAPGTARRGPAPGRRATRPSACRSVPRRTASGRRGEAVRPRGRPCPPAAVPYPAGFRFPVPARLRSLAARRFRGWPPARKARRREVLRGRASFRRRACLPRDCLPRDIHAHREPGFDEMQPCLEHPDALAHRERPEEGHQPQHRDRKGGDDEEREIHGSMPALMPKRRIRGMLSSRAWRCQRRLRARRTPARPASARVRGVPARLRGGSGTGRRGGRRS